MTLAVRPRRRVVAEELVQMAGRQAERLGDARNAEIGIVQVPCNVGLDARELPIA